MKKIIYWHIIIYVTFSLNTQAQQIHLIKSTTGSSGGSMFSSQYKIAFNQTIGQSSLTNLFDAGKIALAQGFQHNLLRANIITQSAFGMKIDIYPNPTSGKVYLKILDDNPLMPLRIQLITMDGKNISEKLLTTDENPAILDYSTITKGMYIIKVVSSNNLLTTDVLVLK